MVFRVKLVGYFRRGWFWRDGLEAGLLEIVKVFLFRGKVEG